MSTSPGVSEFVSDAFDTTAIDQEDLKKEMEQLVLDKKESLPSPGGKHRNTTAGLNDKVIYQLTNPSTSPSKSLLCLWLTTYEMH